MKTSESENCSKNKKKYQSDSENKSQSRISFVIFL